MVSHLILEYTLGIKIEKTSMTWSPVTESNRRPSPYHACRNCLAAADWVGLLQVDQKSVSERIALRLMLAEAVVTWSVTGFPTT
jgi:hypothetical protein